MQDGRIDLFQAQNLSVMVEKLIILMKGRFLSCTGEDSWGLTTLFSRSSCGYGCFHILQGRAWLAFIVGRFDCLFLSTASDAH